MRRCNGNGPGSGSENESTRNLGHSNEDFGDSCRRVTRSLSKLKAGKIESVVGLNRAATMPSVGMRLTTSTRVFGVMMGVDGDRVLRSGRLRLPESVVRTANDGDKWVNNVNMSTNKKNKNSNGNISKDYNNNNDITCMGNEWAYDDKLKREEPVSDIQLLNNSNRKNKRFGTVYSRKRTRMDLEKQDNLRNKMYGIQFSRRQRRKKQGDCKRSLVLAAVVESFCGSKFLDFLNSVLRYFQRFSLRLTELAAFLISEPPRSVFGSHGIRFLWDSPATSRTGNFRFFGTRQFLPLFSVDFSAIPLYFMHMHLSFVFRSRLLSFHVNNSSDDVHECHVLSDGELDNSYIPIEIENMEENMVVIERKISGNRVVLHPSVGTKLADRSTQNRNGLNTCGIRKRRSYARGRKARNPLLVGMHKPSSAIVSDLSSKKNCIPYSSEENVKNESSTVVGVTKSFDLSSCSTNILVVESDKCYRIEGASVTLEISDSRDWVLLVKKDGLTKYAHVAQRNMRPCSSNRFTHDILWSGAENWKLEFPNRQDWLIFRDLYKECSNRNVPVSTPKSIPVPAVHEVFGYENSNNAPFTRPDAYISVNKDEVSRALTKRAANYDINSEDEEWLNLFNNEFFAENDCEHLSGDNFELIVDAFEKAFYCGPDDFADEKATVNLGMEFARREVVEAVYGYWMKKRKQKQTALVRVFQGHQEKKAPLFSIPVIRKRRSFKRSSRFGSGKQPSLLKSRAAATNALEEQNPLLKVAEVKTAAERSVESAILKRQRAQMLMRHADLATYKAARALRIAEAAITDSFD